MRTVDDASKQVGYPRGGQDRRVIVELGEIGAFLRTLEPPENKPNGPRSSFSPVPARVGA